MFTGQIDTGALLELLPYLQERGCLAAGVAGDLKEAIQITEACVTLQRRGASWYRNPSCVAFCCGSFADDHAALASALISALIEDFEQLCETVVVQGYQIIDGTYPQELNESLFWRETRNIDVIAVVATQEQLGYCDAEDDVLAEYVRLILEEGARVLGLELVVKCSGIKMASSWLTEVVIMPGQHARHWLPRDEVKFVAGDARQEIRLRAEAFRRFLSAA